MLKKVFLQTQFGTPHEWTEQYIHQFKRLQPYGWYLKVFTPNTDEPVIVHENVEIIQMSIEQFDQLMAQRCGIEPAGNHLDEKGRPAKFVSDYYPAYGHIFADYIKGFDYWFHSNWDMVYGRLDHFLPDSVLQQCDIWSDDYETINGIFCGYRNNEYVSNLFRQVPEWQRMFREHELFGFDEIHFTMAVRQLSQENKVQFGFPAYYGFHSYDRLIQHVPKPNLKLLEDGALIEMFQDPLHQVMPDHFLMQRGFGREIMSYHFIRTKRWPL